MFPLQGNPPKRQTYADYRKREGEETYTHKRDNSLHLTYGTEIITPNEYRDKRVDRQGEQP